MSATERYREARDLLISLRGRHEEALEQFAWPDVGEQFNWGVDWFDAIARGNDDPALVVVGEDGSSEEISFDAMAARSDRVGPVAARPRASAAATRCCSCSATRWSCGTSCSR